MRTVVAIVVLLALVSVGFCEEKDKAEKKKARQAERKAERAAEKKAEEEEKKTEEDSRKDIPPECIASSSSLLSTCVEEINVATKYFDIDSNDPSTFKDLVIDDEKIEGLLEVLGEPTAACCKGTCEFVNAYCGCNEGMIKLIDGFVAGNFQFFRSVSESIGEKCGVPTYYQENCPKNETEKTLEKFALGNCTQFE